MAGKKKKKRKQKTPEAQPDTADRKLSRKEFDREVRKLQVDLWLNCISHLLSVVPYEKQRFVPPKVGKRLRRPKGVPTELTFRQEVPQVY